MKHLLLFTTILLTLLSSCNSFEEPQSDELKLSKQDILSMFKEVGFEETTSTDSIPTIYIKTKEEALDFLSIWSQFKSHTPKNESRSSSKKFVPLYSQSISGGKIYSFKCHDIYVQFKGPSDLSGNYIIKDIRASYEGPIWPTESWPKINIMATRSSGLLMMILSVDYRFDLNYDDDNIFGYSEVETYYCTILQDQNEVLISINT